jgi:hypothetical protein
MLEGIPRMNESGKTELNTTYFTAKRRLREKKRPTTTEMKGSSKSASLEAITGVATYL